MLFSINVSVMGDQRDKTCGLNSGSPTSTYSIYCYYCIVSLYPLLLYTTVNLIVAMVLGSTVESLCHNRIVL